MIPEKANNSKVYSKRDVAAATEEQKGKLDNKKNQRRVILAETTSSSDSESQPVRRKAQKKKSNAPEIAFDLERKDRPPIIEISSTATDDKDETRPGPVTKEETDETRENAKTPSNVNIPIKASTSWEVKDKEPKRVLERQRVPTQRYGIDVMNVTNIGEGNELK